MHRGDLLNVYYFASKLTIALFFILALFLKDAYGLEEPYRSAVAFFIGLYILVNGVLFLKFKRLKYALNRHLRFLDYALALYSALLATNIYGIIPVGFVIALYSVVYFREVLFLFLASIAIMLANMGFFGRFEDTELLIAAPFLLGMLTVSSKFNIISMLKDRKESLHRLKREIFLRDRTVALHSKQLSLYEEVEEILDKISQKRYLEDLPSILKGLLKAESVIIRKKNHPYQVLADRDFVNVSVGNIHLAVKPAEKYLIGDKRYREKLQLLAKILRPYLESFLAKSR